MNFVGNIKSYMESSFVHQNNLKQEGFIFTMLAKECDKTNLEKKN